MPQHQSLQNSELMVPPHFIDHARAMDHHTANALPGQDKIVQAIAPTGDELFLDGIAVSLFFLHGSNLPG